jgi:hypothetical protein
MERLVIDRRDLASMDKPEQSEQRRPKLRVDIIALFTAIATAVVGYFTVRVAHEDSVNAMQLSNRPYLGVQGSLVIGKVDGKSAALVTLHFTASGASPALDANVQRRCVAAETARRSENGQNVLVAPDNAWSRLAPTVSHSVIFPNNSLDFHCVAFLDPTPPPYVFAVGNVTYKNVFGKGHGTSFCFENTTDGGPESRPMLPCSTGNKME